MTELRQGAGIQAQGDQVSAITTHLGSSPSTWAGGCSWRPFSPGRERVEMASACEPGNQLESNTWGFHGPLMLKQSRMGLDSSRVALQSGPASQLLYWVW